MGKGFWMLAMLLAGVVLGAAEAAAAGSGAYRVEVPDAGVVGKGSAFAGEANRASALFYNPAGMTQIDGNSVSVGATMIQPHIVAKTSTGESEMQAHSFGIPHAYVVSDLGSEKFALGFGTVSSWGLATEWNADSFARYSATKSSVENKDYMIAAAYQATEQLSLSLGVDVDDSTVDKRKKIYQAAGGDADFRLKGTSNAVGYRLAGLFRINERHQFGAMYRSKIEHKYRGTVMLDNLNNTYVVPGIGQTYQTIFGGASYETEVEAKNTLPQSIVLGYSYKPAAKWTFNADLEWMDWSSTEKEELGYPTESSAARLAVLNNGNPAPRDWASVLSGALGVQYEAKDWLRFRTGYYYHTSPIPGDTWEPNLPDSNSHGITAGVGLDLRRNLTLDLAWSGLWYENRVIDNTVADDTAALTGGIDGTYQQWVNLVYATVTCNF